MKFRPRNAGVTSIQFRVHRTINTETSMVINKTMWHIGAPQLRVLSEDDYTMFKIEYSDAYEIEKDHIAEVILTGIRFLAHGVATLDMEKIEEVYHISHRFISR